MSILKIDYVAIRSAYDRSHKSSLSPKYDGIVPR
jgi:hypothetical protein